MKHLLKIMMIVCAVCTCVIFTSCNEEQGFDFSTSSTLDYICCDGDTHNVLNKNDLYGSSLEKWAKRKDGAKWISYGRFVMWSLELPYVGEEDYMNGRLEFHIFSKDVKVGFEFTESNFIEVGNHQSTYQDIYTKHSGTGRVVKMDSKTAVIEFKDFVMRHEKGSKNETILNGTVVVDVDGEGEFASDYIDYDGITMIKNGRYLCVKNESNFTHFSKYDDGLYDEENGKTYYGAFWLYGKQEVDKTKEGTLFFYLLSKDIKSGLELSNETILMGGFLYDNYRIKSGTGRVVSVTDSYVELEFDNMIFEQTDGVSADVVVNGRSKIRIN